MAARDLKSLFLQIPFLLVSLSLSPSLFFLSLSVSLSVSLSCLSLSLSLSLPLSLSLSLGDLKTSLWPFTILSHEPSSSSLHGKRILQRLLYDLCCRVGWQIPVVDSLGV